MATIAGTMMPRLMQDAYRSNMSRFVYRSVGMIMFLMGLGLAVLLESLTG